MSPPTKRQINNLTRRGDAVERSESFQNNCSLLLDIAWLTQRMTKRPLQVDAAWRLNLFCELANDGDANGGDTGFFDFSLDQSHGLIADASSRGEQNHVDMILFELFYHLLSSLPDQAGNMSTVDMAHERVVGVGQLANHSLLF